MPHLGPGVCVIGAGGRLCCGVPHLQGLPPLPSAPGVCVDKGKKQTRLGVSSREWGMFGISEEGLASAATKEIMKGSAQSGANGVERKEPVALYPRVR